MPQQYKTFDVGDLVRLTGTFRETSGGGLIDPSSVKLHLRRPDNTRQTYVAGSDLEVDHPELGIYRLQVPADMPGMYFYRWEADGTATGAESGGFHVQVPKV